MSNFKFNIYFYSSSTIDRVSNFKIFDMIRFDRFYRRRSSHQINRGIKKLKTREKNVWSTLNMHFDSSANKSLFSRLGMT